jgi:hypothetical protein
MKRLTMFAVVAILALTACATRAGSTLGPAPTSSTRAAGSPSPKPSTPRSAKSAKPTVKKPVGQPVVRKDSSCKTVSGGSEGSVAQLVDVRVGAHEAYDRVTFEFAPAKDGQHFALPAYQVKAATPPITQDGSGASVDVDGTSFAVMVMQGASGVDFTGQDGYEITYHGPKAIRPGYEALAEATQTGDFEAVLSWAFGLNQGSCWTVLELKDPVRLAIDFQH